MAGNGSSDGSTPTPSCDESSSQVSSGDEKDTDDFYSSEDTVVMCNASHGLNSNTIVDYESPQSSVSPALLMANTASLQQQKMSLERRKSEQNRICTSLSRPEVKTGGRNTTSCRDGCASVIRPRANTRRNSAPRPKTPISSSATTTTTAGVLSVRGSPQTSRRTSKPSSGASSTASTPPSSPSRFRSNRSPTTSLKKPLSVSMLGTSGVSHSTAATSSLPTSSTSTTSSSQKKQLYYPHHSTANHTTPTTTESHRNLKPRLSVTPSNSTSTSDRLSKDPHKSKTPAPKSNQSTSRFHTTPVLDDMHYKTSPSSEVHKARTPSKDSLHKSDSLGKYSAKSDKGTTKSGILNKSSNGRPHSQLGLSIKDNAKLSNGSDPRGGKENLTISSSYRGVGDPHSISTTAKVSRNKPHDCNIPLSAKQQKVKHQEHSKMPVSKEKHSKLVNPKKFTEAQ